MSKPVISVEHLTKRYDLGVISSGTLQRDFNRWWARMRGKPDPYTKIGQDDHGNRKGESILALDDISFKVQQGEVLGIIGKNGAGKSTLLKILSQVTAPTSGRVRIRGRVGSLLEVGTGFHPELTGRENVYLNGAILGMTRAEVDRKFDEIVDFSGVEQFIDTPVKRYSSGMYVRLAFAVAAHLDPEILIVDEVLAVGDAEFQKKCLGKMGAVASEGRTVLFVSHDMVSINILCNHAILLSNGSITISGHPEDVITSYLHMFQTAKNMPIKTRTDRKGNQSLVFTNVEICNKNYEKINRIRTGQELIVKLAYSSKTQLEDADIHVSFVVYDQEYPLINVNSFDSGQSKMDIFNQGYFECVWPKFNLTPKTYNCSLFCSINGQISDWIEYAFELEVVEGDFFNSGIRLEPQSKFLVYHQWYSKPGTPN